MAVYQHDWVNVYHKQARTYFLINTDSTYKYSSYNTVTTPHFSKWPLFCFFIVNADAYNERKKKLL